MRATLIMLALAAGATSTLQPATAALGPPQAVVRTAAADVARAIAADDDAAGAIPAWALAALGIAIAIRLSARRGL